MSKQQAISSELQTSYRVVAQYYDTVYGAALAPNDVPFYLELAASLPGPVLELGCGTGRVALALAQAGHEVHGLDISPEMLGVFRRKLESEPLEVQERVTLHEGSMAQFDLGRKFGLILTPFRAFMHLLSIEDQRSCLECVRRSLLPEGRYVHNLFDPNIEYVAKHVRQGPVWMLDHETEIPASGHILRRFHMLKPEPAEQTHRLWFRYEEYDGQGQLLSTGVDRADMRWQYRHEAQYLLELCGLDLVAAYGGYDKTPLDERFRDLLFVCQPQQGAKQ